MQVKVDKLAKSQVKLTVVIPVLDVKKAYDSVVDKVVANAEIQGFRKGKAPKDKVLEKTDTSKLHGEVLNSLLEKYYPQAIKEHHLQPVSNPKVEIQSFELEQDLEFEATVAVKPEVKLGDYKQAIKQAYDAKAKEVKEQNAAKLKAGEELSTDHVHLTPNEIIEAVLSTAHVEVADLLIDQEVDRMLARLVDQAQQVGLSLEKYLESQHKTADQLRNDYAQIAEKSLKSEFVLAQLVIEEKVQVSYDELVQTLKDSKVPNAEEKLKDPTEKWYIQSILEKNNLLTKLAKEVEGENHE